MGIIGTAWPNPKKKSNAPPARRPTLEASISTMTGNTSEMAQGAQASENRMPSKSAPVSGERPHALRTARAQPGVPVLLPPPEPD
jgi:hypothetical protein